MRRPGDFQIPFRDLGVGDHRFEMAVDDDFFAAFAPSLVALGAAQVVVQAHKTPASLTLDVAIRGEAEVECDRCLGPLRLPVDFAGELKVRQGEGDYDGQVLFVAHGEERIDLAQYVYESICLSLPARRVHEDVAQCDPAMLARLMREN